MSSDRCIVFIGVRREISEEEIDLCESDTHPIMDACKREGLQVYWFNADSSGERFLLLVGKLIGILGRENSNEVSVSADQVAALITFVHVKLMKAGIEGSPMLSIQLEPVQTN
jgi:hypothetical protein